MSLEGFEQSLGGKWILLRNEGFDEYLAAMGKMIIYVFFFVLIRYLFLLNTRGVHFYTRHCSFVLKVLYTFY